jgi:uncharacterized protein YjbI with pentapeptide repeats
MGAHSPFEARDVFNDEIFTNLDLEGVEVADKEFNGCTFRNVKLGNTRWPETTFESCVFDDCDLVRMVPERMRLRGTEFRRCRLMGVDWTNVARNPDVKFVDCNLRYSSFVGLSMRKTEFSNCALIEAVFIDMDLIEATFHACDMSGATFTQCNLSKADMSQARGLFIDTKGNTVKGLRISTETAIALATAAGMVVPD